MSPKCWNRQFLNSASFMRRVSKSCWRTPLRDTSLHLRSQDRLALEGKRRGYTLTTKSFPQNSQQHVQAPLLRLWLLQGEKRTQKGPPTHSSTGVVLWEPLFWAYAMRSAGEFVELCNWESDCDGEGGRRLKQPARESWQARYILAMLK